MTKGENGIGEARSNGLPLSLIAVKLVCCGGLVLFASAGLAGLGSWFSGVGPLIAVGMAVSLIALVPIWRYMTGRWRRAGDPVPIPVRMTFGGERE